MRNFAHSYNNDFSKLTMSNTKNEIGCSQALHMKDMQHLSVKIDRTAIT